MIKITNMYLQVAWGFLIAKITREGESFQSKLASDTICDITPILSLLSFFFKQQWIKTERGIKFTKLSFLQFKCALFSCCFSCVAKKQSGGFLLTGFSYGSLIKSQWRGYLRASEMTHWVRRKWTLKKVYHTAVKCQSITFQKFTSWSFILQFNSCELSEIVKMLSLHQCCNKVLCFRHHLIP